MGLEALQCMATAMLDRLGTQVVVGIQNAPAYDPSTRSATAGVIEETTVYGVIGAYDDSEYGEQIKMTDVPLYLPGTITRPKSGDLVTVDGRRMRVVAVRATYASGVVALYTCQVRQ